MPADEEARRALGQAIRIARSRRNWTQKQLGQAADIDQGYISDIERGERDLSFSTQHRIATALDLTVTQLLAAAEEEQRHIQQRDLDQGSQIADDADHDEAQPER